MNERLEITTLSNGFRVVSETMPGLGSTALGVWIDVGARFETPEENGAAHMLEHMAFKGTGRRNARQIVEEIEDVGGYLNAYTGREITAYHFRVLAEDTPLALDLLGDILRNSTLDPKELERERDVILQEIGESLDTPDDIVFDWMQETAFPDQALGRPVLGTRDTVRALSRDMIASYLERHYRPSRMVLAAAGAVDHAALVKAAEASFGDMAATSGPEMEPARYQGGDMRKVKELEQAHVLIALPGPTIRETEAYYRAQVFSTAFGGGMSSRLFQTAREERGLCYTIYSYLSSFEDAGLFTIYSGTGGDRAAELMNLVADELKRAADDFTDAETNRARAQLKAGMVMGLESPMARAERIARQLITHNRIIPLEETVERVEAIDAAALRDFAGSLVHAGTPTLALYGPVAAAPEHDSFTARLRA